MHLLSDRVLSECSSICYHIDYVQQGFSHIPVTDFYTSSALSFGHVESTRLSSFAGAQDDTGEPIRLFADAITCNKVKNIPTISKYL